MPMPNSPENTEILSKYYELSKLNKLEKPNNTSNLNILLVKTDMKNNYSKKESSIKNLFQKYLYEPKNNSPKQADPDPRLMGHILSHLNLPIQAPTPADDAKAFEDALAKALSPDDLGTAAKNPNLTEMPRDGITYSGNLKKEIQVLSNNDLVNRIRNLEDSMRDLPTVSPNTQAELASLLEEARRRRVDLTSLPVTTPPDTTTEITVSQLFSSKTPDTPTRPVTGLEHEATEVLMRKRENLEKSGLPKDIIDALRKTIDQELTYRELSTENNT